MVPVGQSMEGRRRVHIEEVPLELATGVWRRLVTGADGLLDRRAYTFCGSLSRAT